MAIIKIKTNELPSVAAIAKLHGLVAMDCKKPDPAWPSISTMATSRLAPELNPNTSGPASGFRNSVCMSKPPVANADPASTQVIDFGRRNCQMISDRVEFPEEDKKVNQSTGPMNEFPRDASAKNKIIKSKPNPNVDFQNTDRLVIGIICEK